MGENFNQNSAKGSIMIRHSMVEHIKEDGNESITSLNNRPIQI